MIGCRKLYNQVRIPYTKEIGEDPIDFIMVFTDPIFDRGVDS